MCKRGVLVAAAVALTAFVAPPALADPAGPIVLRCEVWGAGGPDGFHLVGYAQGMGDSRAEAQADAERDMRSAYGLGPNLGHCVSMFG